MWELILGAGIELRMVFQLFSYLFYHKFLVNSLFNSLNNSWFLNYVWDYFRENWGSSYAHFLGQVILELRVKLGLFQSCNFTSRPDVKFLVWISDLEHILAIWISISSLDVYNIILIVCLWLKSSWNRKAPIYTIIKW